MMETDRNSMMDTANARSQVYGLMAAIFRAEPTAAFLKELKGRDLSEIFSELGIDLGHELQEKSEEELLEELADIGLFHTKNMGVRLPYVKGIHPKLFRKLVDQTRQGASGKRLTYAQ